MRKIYDGWPLGIPFVVICYFIIIFTFCAYQAGDEDWNSFWSCFIVFGIMGTTVLFLSMIGLFMQKELIGFPIFDFDRMVAREACIEYKKWHQKTKSHDTVIITVTKDLKKVMLLLSEEEIVLKRSSRYLQEKPEINQWNRGVCININNALENASQRLKKTYPAIRVLINSNRGLGDKCDECIKNNITEWKKVETKYIVKAIKKNIFSEGSFWWLFFLGVLLSIFWMEGAKGMEQEGVALVLSLWKESKWLCGFILCVIIALICSACFQLSFLFGLISGKGMQCVGRIASASFIAGGKKSSAYYSLDIEVKKKILYDIHSGSAKYKYNFWKYQKNVIVVTINEKRFLLFDD